MKIPYRVLNGMKARGVPKNFSPEERQRRSELAKTNQCKAVAAVVEKARLRRERLEEHRQLVKDAASLGHFIPVQGWE